MFEKTCFLFGGKVFCLCLVCFVLYIAHFKDMFQHFGKHVQKCEEVSHEMLSLLQKNVIYWYFRRQEILVFSARNITDIFGGNYYWYFRAEILYRHVAFVGLI